MILGEASPRPGFRVDARQVGLRIERRLWILQGGLAGLEGPGRAPRFSRLAVRLVARLSGGDPSLIDACCDRAVALARSRGRATVGVRLALKALTDLGAIGLPRPRMRPPAPVAAMLAATIAVGAMAAASFQQPKPASREHSTTPAEPFSAFRAAMLDRASRLSDKPDVRGLLALQADVREAAGRTANHDPAAVDALLLELERLIEGARERQLAIDRELILQHAER